MILKVFVKKTKAGRDLAGRQLAVLENKRKFHLHRSVVKQLFRTADRGRDAAEKRAGDWGHLAWTIEGMSLPSKLKQQWLLATEHQRTVEVSIAGEFHKQREKLLTQIDAAF